MGSLRGRDSGRASRSFAGGANTARTSSQLPRKAVGEMRPQLARPRVGRHTANRTAVAAPVGVRA